MSFLNLFSDNFFSVFFAIFFLSISTSMVGVFNFLQRKSLLSDALSHSCLPGICVAFILTGKKNLYILTIGGIVSTLFWLFVLNKIIKKSKIKEDAATSIILVVSFSIGIVILSMIQKFKNFSQSGLNNFLLGKIACILDRDLYTIYFLSIFIFFSFVIFFRNFFCISFDKNFSHSIGINVNLIEIIFTFLTVLVIVFASRIVGILLVSSMMITPCVSARFWTNSLKKMIFISFFLSVFAGLIGIYFSLIKSNISTGPVIVFFLTIFAYLSFLFAPKKGILFKKINQIKHKNTMIRENILKYLYCKGQNNNYFSFNIKEEEKNISNNRFNFINFLKKLEKKSFLTLDLKNDKFFLTESGILEGEKIINKHLLWESYLRNNFDIKENNLHENAEIIEHVLTENIVEDLKREKKK
jgi:manganese/zinc/iron transport system permease protein